jgi:hypothetical protein
VNLTQLVELEAKDAFNYFITMGVTPLDNVTLPGHHSKRETVDISCE